MFMDSVVNENREVIFANQESAVMWWLNHTPWAGDLRVYSMKADRLMTIGEYSESYHNSLLRRIVTEEMITRASEVLWREMAPPFIFDASELTDEDIRNGKLREQDELCEKQNREIIKRALEAALEGEK